MRRTVLILPGLAGEGESILRDPPAALRPVVESGQVGRLSAPVPAQVPEAAAFGVSPETIDLAPGPIAVAALGVDPPERSVHFHLSLLSLDASGALALPKSAPPGDAAQLLEAARRLDTERLKIVPGIGLDHGLVWEDGSIDLGCTTPVDGQGRPLEQVLPEGDGERMLRRFIFDSVEVLSACEANRRREDEGLAPLNLLWPWGPGFRNRTPNLALRRGEPALLVSGSFRMAGLARLFGDRCEPLSAFGAGMGLRLGDLRERLAKAQLGVFAWEAFAVLRERARYEEAAHLLQRLADEMIEPLERDATPEAPVRIAIASPGSDGGLTLLWDSLRPGRNAVPFDERAAEEPRLPRKALWEFVDSSMRSDWPSASPR